MNVPQTAAISDIRRFIMSMRVKELLEIGEKQLRECDVADAAIDNKLLYCFLMHVPSGRLILEYQNILPDEQCDAYFKLLDRRCSGEPLQYITGMQEFMGLPFTVNPSVLIPRQDTEILVENGISVIKENKLDGEELPLKPRKNWEVLDLCTGSGAIGISVAKLCAQAGLRLTCSDVSEDALSVAKENAQKNHVQAEFVCGDLFAPFRKRFRKRRFDAIFSNPPYIRSAVIPSLQREITEHEPMLALDGGADGMAFYRRIISEAPDFLRKQGILMLEIGFDQLDDVTSLLEENGRYEHIQGLKDLAGRDRVVFACAKGDK